MSTSQKYILILTWK